MVELKTVVYPKKTKMTFSATRLNGDLKNRFLYKIDYYRKISFCMPECVIMKFTPILETMEDINKVNQ